MRSAELIAALRNRPFQPFRLFISDGAAFDIRHPEMLMVTRHSAIVGLQENGHGTASAAEYPQIERHTVVDLLHITRIEQLPAVRQAPDSGS